MAQNGFDHDWLIVGSGFGGSVSALRLSEKGYRVAVLECGRRYRDEDYAASTWDLRRFMWAPALGLRGILRLTPFKDVFIASGSAVGGGSVVYACTLYRGAPEFFVNPQWAGLEDWAAALKPHYDTAERMLGVNTVPFDSDGQTLLKQVAGHFGVEDTFRRTPVGIYFGEPGQQVADPYFGGSGPARTGCTRCGACMVGCRVGAKNTLVKNYLWFAEKAGAQVAARARGGRHPPARRRRRQRRLSRHHRAPRCLVQQAAAQLHTRAAWSCRRARWAPTACSPSASTAARCPAISDRLGELVRTNSESILAVTLPDDKLNPANDVAISASIHPRPDTHIEFVTYGAKGDFMSTQFTMITGDGTRLTRPLRLLGSIVRHPLRFAKVLWPFGWGRRTVIFLVMQTLDNAIAFRAKRRLVRWHRPAHRTGSREAQPDLHPGGQRGRRMAGAHTGGIAQSMVLEATANIPSTAHILGGAVIGKDAGSGVVDRHNRVFGYRNLLVCDGAAMPANPGVNPSLTITAITEHAMSHIPPAQRAR